MDKKLEQMAAAAVSQPDVADKLEQLIACPNDRAYIVCNYLDCKQNKKGQCTIYMVLDHPPLADGSPCDGYEKTSRSS